MKRLASLAIAALGSITSAETNPSFDPTLTTRWQCLGETLQSCKSLLQKSFKGDFKDFNRVLLRAPSVDVSGRPIHDRQQVNVRVILKNATGDAALGNAIAIYSNEKGIVDALEFDVRDDPATARTKEEYQKTGIAELMLPFMPRMACAYNTETGVYQFFNSTIKSAITGPTRDAFEDVDVVSDEYVSDSPFLPFCGAQIHYNKRQGVSTSQMASYNPSGRFSRIQIAVWTAR